MNTSTIRWSQAHHPFEGGVAGFSALQIAESKDTVKKVRGSRGCGASVDVVDVDAFGVPLCSPSGCHEAAWQEPC